MFSVCFIVLNSLFLTFNIVHIVFSSDEDDTGKVIFVSILYRHGDRTPIAPYPNDPYLDTSYWPVPFGHLSNVGKQQHFELGQWLRVRCDSLLGEHYSPDIIYVQSTDVDRTLMSAECNLAGMFPPRNEQVWNQDIRWQPIPVHTIPEDMDNILSVKKSCPTYDEAYKKLLASKEVKIIKDNFPDVYEVLNSHTGSLTTTIQHVAWLYSHFTIQRLNNLTLPEWTKPIFPERMGELAIYDFILPTRTKILASLKTGVLLNDIIENMNNKVNGSKLNVKVYSAHDTTLTALMNTIDIFDRKFPPFAACLMIELRVDSAGGYFVTIFYRNMTIGDPFPLEIPNCPYKCSLELFIDQMEPFRLTDAEWDKECNKGSNTILYIGLAILVTLIMLLGLGVIIWLLKKKSSQNVSSSNANQTTDAERAEPTEQNQAGAYSSRPNIILRVVSDSGTQYGVIQDSGTERIPVCIFSTYSTGKPKRL